MPLAGDWEDFNPLAAVIQGLNRIVGGVNVNRKPATV